jgi:nickel transport protein
VRGAAGTVGAVLVLLCGPGSAGAHEVLHEVVRDRAVAVRARFPDGEPLAYVAAEVFSPADPKVPHWKGRTDRNGWVAFVPDATGAWRVRILDATGHGLETTVAVATLAEGGAAGSSGPGTFGFLLRPALGAAVIAGIFAVLYGIRRRGKA